MDDFVRLKHKNGQLVVIPPRCALGCNRYLTDADGGSICLPCVKRLCTCEPPRTPRTPRTHLPTCPAVLSIELLA